LTDWLAVQPDIQYIINPGAVSGLRDALALGIRLEIGTTF
jgi:porin